MDGPSPSQLFTRWEGGAGELGGTLPAIAARGRRDHVDHAMAILQKRSEPETRSDFDDKVYRLTAPAFWIVDDHPRAMLRRRICKEWTLREVCHARL